MNVCFFRHSILNRGGDRMVVAYANGLALRCHQVTVRTSVVDTVFTLDSGVRVENTGRSGKAGTLFSALRDRIAADVIIADIIPTALFLFPRNRHRVFYFAQDYNENAYPALVQKLIIRLLYGVGLRLCRIPVIAVSDHLERIFWDRFRARVQVVSNGVDLKTFHPEPSEDLLAAKRGRKAILIFSRRDPRKGFDLALAVLNRLAGMHLPSLEVWTVGDPLHEDDLSLPRRDFGYVGAAELRRIYSSADLLLYPSRNEGFPLMPLEAFACGCPVVTSKAVPYAVEEENSLVAEVGDVPSLVDKCCRVLTEPLLTGRLTDAARRFAETHSFHQALNLFEQVLSAGSAP